MSQSPQQYAHSIRKQTSFSGDVTPILSAARTTPISMFATVPGANSGSIFTDLTTSSSRSPGSPYLPRTFYSQREVVDPIECFITRASLSDASSSDPQEHEEMKESANVMRPGNDSFDLDNNNLPSFDSPVEFNLSLGI